MLPSRVASPDTLAKVMGPPRTNAHVQPGVADAVDDGAEPDRGREREAAADVALAPAEHRGVHRDHQGLVALGLGSLHHVGDQPPVPPHVHLEPLRARR